jgi:hypothetical protein
MSGSLFANDYRVEMRLKEADRVKKTVDRVNNFYEFINLYLLHSGNTSVPLATRDQLKAFFVMDSRLWRNYDHGEFKFSFMGDQIIIDQVMLSDHADYIVNMLILNPKLHPLAKAYNVGDYWQIRIPFMPKTKLFLEKVQQLSANPDILFSATVPPLSNQLWYQPDGQGGFLRYRQQDGLWTRIEESQKIFTVDAVGDLLVLSDVRKGDYAYVGLASSASSKYVYNGTQWLKSNRTSTFSNQRGVCNGAHQYGMRYEVAQDCISYCDGSNWVCIPD